MTPFLGEKVLQLGKILENFPITPALHLTFYHSQKDHLDTAFFMMNRGANPNKFELPSHYSEDYKYEYMKHMNNPSVSNNKYKKDNIVDYLNISYGYPPAIMYCLGLGKIITSIFNLQFYHIFMKLIFNRYETKRFSCSIFTENISIITISI